MNTFDRTKKYKMQQIKKENIYEKAVGNFLKDNKISHKYQLCIPPYIVDFFFPRKGLIIEIDGTIHNKKINQIKDALREEYLSSFGIFIMRYNTSKTKQSIKDFITTQLNIFPDLKDRRYYTIQNRINIMKNIAKDKDFKIFTTKSYLNILFSYRSWKKSEKWKLRMQNEFPNWWNFKKTRSQMVLTPAVGYFNWRHYGRD